MVLGEEIELDIGSDLCSEIVGTIFEDPAFADSDFDGRSDLSIDGSGRDGCETKEGIGELHSVYLLMAIIGIERMIEGDGSGSLGNKVKEIVAVA